MYIIFLYVEKYNKSIFFWYFHLSFLGLRDTHAETHRYIVDFSFALGTLNKKRQVCLNYTYLFIFAFDRDGMWQELHRLLSGRQIYQN